MTMESIYLLKAILERLWKQGENTTHEHVIIRFHNLSHNLTVAYVKRQG